MANYSAPSTEAHSHSLPSGLNRDSAEISSSTPRRSLDPRRPRPENFLLPLRHASRHVFLCRHHCLVLRLLCRRRGNYMYLTCSPCDWSLSKATPFSDMKTLIARLLRQVTLAEAWILVIAYVAYVAVC